jgi:hypothetical protein
VAATATTAALSLITLAAASPSTAPARPAAFTAPAGTAAWDFQSTWGGYAAVTPEGTLVGEVRRISRPARAWPLP